MSETTSQTQSNQERLIAIIAPMIAPLGYDIVHLEILTGRQKILRLFIDHLAPDPSRKGVGIEDCATVSRALDEPLDQLPEVDKVFGGGTYELEVSSPGIDRPLRRLKDYERFAGQEARIHVYRPLTAEELENADYQQKNPKQKNFVGVLKGVREQKVLIALSAGPDSARKAKKKEKAAAPEGHQILIPLSLISKANLEPKFDLLEKETS